MDIEKILCIGAVSFFCTLLPIVAISNHISNEQALRCMETNKSRIAADVKLLCGEVKR